MTNSLNAVVGNKHFTVMVARKNLWASRDGRRLLLDEHRRITGVCWQCGGF